MTGPEHYREAEQVLARVKNRAVTADEAISHAAVAAVHATLALTAAMARPLFGDDKADRDEWKQAIS
jgi:hypothetical protein